MTTGAPVTNWQDRLTTAQHALANATIPAFIEFCREVHAFRSYCETVSGGSTFTSDGCAWLKCSPAQLSRWAAVGSRGSQLLCSAQKLPSSEFAVSRIASLDDGAFNQALDRIRPDMTRDDVRELVAELKPTPEKPPVDARLVWRKRRKKVEEAIADWPVEQLAIFARMLFARLPPEKSESLIKRIQKSTNDDH